MPSPSVPYIARRPIPPGIEHRAVCPGTLLQECHKRPEWVVLHPVASGFGHAAMCDDHAEAQLIRCQRGCS